MPVTSLPPAQDTELSLSVERAYRESLVTDRLGALWSLILAKCFLAQWAILQFAIPINGPRYIWTLTLIMAVVASAYYLHAHRVRLYLLPTHFRVNAAVLAGLVVALGFVAYAYFARGLLSAPLASSGGGAAGFMVPRARGLAPCLATFVRRLSLVGSRRHGPAFTGRPSVALAGTGLVVCAGTAGLRGRSPGVPPPRLIRPKP